MKFKGILKDCDLPEESNEALEQVEEIKEGKVETYIFICVYIYI